MNKPLDILVSAIWAVFSSLFTVVIVWMCGLTSEWTFSKQLLLLVIVFLCNFLFMAFLFLIGRKMNAS